jgi:hypothetical protein
MKDQYPPAVKQLPCQNGFDRTPDKSFIFKGKKDLEPSGTKQITKPVAALSRSGAFQPMARSEHESPRKVSRGSKQI